MLALLHRAAAQSQENRSLLVHIVLSFSSFFPSVFVVNIVKAPGKKQQS